MKILQRVANWMGMEQRHVPSPALSQLRTALDEGRRYKRAESYENAIECFNRAVRIADSLEDPAARSIIQLQLSDLHIRKGEPKQAQALLDGLAEEAQRTNNPTQEAYVLVMEGTLAQAAGDWVGARARYEKAMVIAREHHVSGAEGRAMGHLADVSLYEGNASFAVHLLREALPKLNSTGDVELSSYFVGRLGEAEIATGHDSEGYDLLSRALRIAQNMNYRRYIRMWHAVIGRVAAGEGKLVDAYRHFQEALKLMPADAPELPELMRELARVCLNLGHLDEALTNISKAKLLLPDDLETRGVFGLVLRAVGESAEAIPHLEEAARDDSRIDLLRSLAAAYGDTGDDAQAMATFQRALDAAKSREDVLEVARTYRDLGLYHYRRRRHHDALDALQDALSRYEKLDMHAQVARLYCDLANLRLYLGQGQRATKDFEQALQRLGSVDDAATRGVVLSNAALIYMDKGDLDTAESFFAESIKLAQKSQDQAAEATRQGNFGWYLLATGRTKRALGALEYALQHSERLGLELHVAVQTGNLALVHAELGDRDRAERDLRQSLAQVDGLSEPFWQAIIRINLAAQLAETRSDSSEGLRLVDEALVLAERIESAEAMVRGLTVRARLLLIDGDLNEALRLVEDAVARARKAGMRRLLAEALAVASRAHIKRGEREQAESTWKEAHRLAELVHHPMAQTSPGWLAAV
jgi:tetratricopeptide (TPR) repeat protein